MQLVANPVGRPTKTANEVDVRKSLIECATRLFLNLPYDKVSTRLISQRAGVSSSLVRYYFGSKEGLFETVIQDLAPPMYKQTCELMENANYNNFVEMVSVLFRELAKRPQLPKLLSQFMSLPPTDSKRQIVEQILVDHSSSLHNVIFQKLIQAGVLRQDMDPKLCRLSWVSLMMYPFTMPTALFNIHDMELKDEFFERLLEHNIQLMTHGFIQNPEENIQPMPSL